MTDFSKVYDVAVIDEIQMIADDSRGNHWTNALIGLQAHEIHVCGDPRALGLVRTLCEQTQDTFEAHEYKRLSKLNVENTEITSLKDLKEGDCIVAFSRMKLFQIRDAINSQTPNSKAESKEKDLQVKYVEQVTN